MTIILWLAAILFGSVLGIAFGRLAAQLPIAAVAQSVVAASAASIVWPVIVFISTEVPMAVSLRMLPLAVVMSLWDKVIAILIFALMIASLHAALALSTRLAPRRPILLGILGGLLGAVAVGPAIKRLTVAPAPSHVQNRVSQTRVFHVGRSDQPQSERRPTSTNCTPLALGVGTWPRLATAALQRGRARAGRVRGRTGSSSGCLAP